MVRSIFMHIIASVLGHWFLITIHLELSCGNVLCCETFGVDIKMLIKHHQPSPERMPIALLISCVESQLRIRVEKAIN